MIELSLMEFFSLIMSESAEDTMLVGELMTKDIVRVESETSVREVVVLMQSHDTGVVPVCNKGHVIGIITDRDIVLRLLVDGTSIADELAESIMTSKVVTCHPDQTVNEIAAIMGDHQIRRLPVINHDNVVVGMVTVGDIARDASEYVAGEAFGEIVEER